MRARASRADCGDGASPRFSPGLSDMAHEAHFAERYGLFTKRNCAEAERPLRRAWTAVGCAGRVRLAPSSHTATSGPVLLPNGPKARLDGV